MTDDTGRRPDTSRVALVLTVATALLVNYVDRGNLATAAPMIEAQLSLTKLQLGVLLSAFFWAYMPLMIPAGWLADRWGGHRVLAIGLVIWSAATFLTGFAGSFAAILVLRLLLGVGESGAFPCTSSLFASALLPKQMGTANGIVGLAYLMGPSLGTLLGGWLMPRWGWQNVFIVFGVASLLWVVPLWRMRPPPRPAEVPGAEPVSARASAASPTWPQIFSQRGLWGSAIGHFADNYGFYFILAWAPTYYVQVRGLSMQRMGVVLSVAYATCAVGAFVGGMLCDAWVRSGRSANFIYKALFAANSVSAIVAMVGIPLLPLNESIGCLIVYEAVLGLAAPGVFVIPQIMAGPTAAGRWVGIQNGAGNIAGIVAPMLAGALVDATGNYVGAFVVAAAVSALIFIGWVLVLPRADAINWTKTSGAC